MALKTFVKVGRITNLSDARYCAGMGVDMLGFQAVVGHKNYIVPSQFQEIRGWITGPLVVAEVYGLQNLEELNAILENFKPDYLEMGLKELSLFPSLSLPLILAVDAADELVGLPVQPAYIISAQSLKTPVPQLLEVRTIADVEKALDDTKTKGIALEGGRELKPGLKDYELLNEILEMLEEDV
ncbi:MAG TPA: hypothetical protein VFZ52_03010 [Chryseolinea sp.]